MDPVRNEESKVDGFNHSTLDDSRCTFTPIVVDYSPEMSPSLGMNATHLPPLGSISTTLTGETVPSKVDTLINRPTSNVALQPPPFFPTEVIQPDTPPISTKLLDGNDYSDMLSTTLVDSVNPTISCFTSCSSFSEDFIQQSRFLSYWSLNNDDELAQFLLDVDLDTDGFEVHPTGIQMTGV